jgi:UDP-GlcNAc:undecaprenyl-phosphate/decaprenyl-phosphate GlcNAc-1-phosphate transferase
MAVAAFLSFVVTVLFMFALRPVALAAGLIDVPGGRKKHGHPVPVIGGIAMSIGLGVGTRLVGSYPDSWMPVLIGVYLLVVVGTIDDRFDLPANVRLIAQSCAALLVAIASGVVVTDIGQFFESHIGLGPLAVPFTILFVVTLVNAFNFIDGLDGLAGGLALLALAIMAIMSVHTPLFALVLVAASVVGGYLLFNLPLGVNQPVRAFMGDAGSTSLGLIIATVGVYLSQGATPVLSPVAGLWLVAVPVFDLFTTVGRRLLTGRSPFVPDRGHLHHVLPDNGLSRRSTLVFMLGLALLFAAIGVLGHVLGVSDDVMLLLWLAAGVVYYQLLRFPRFIVAVVLWARRPHAPEFVGELASEETPTSET